MARDSDAGPELMCVKRPLTMRFLGGFHAFPGGSLDPADYSDAAMSLSVLGAHEAQEDMGDASGDLPALGFYICAIRELFEETGVLLTTDSGMDAGEVVELAIALRQRDVSFPDAIQRLGVRLATDKLRFHSRWLAPSALPVRFDVRVFVAEATGTPVPDRREVDRIDWLTCMQLLGRSETGTVLLAPPTITTISSLARFSSVAEMIEGGAPAQAGEVQSHSDLVRRIVAPNPSLLTGPGTNTYLVGNDEALICIDPGSMEPAHVEAISSVGRLQEVVITHWHPDHLAGALELAESVGNQVTAPAKFWKRANLVSVGRALNDGDTIEVPGVTLTALETPGHASDHMCFWFEKESSLFSGDLVLGEGTTVISPPDGNLADYLDSLKKVAKLEARRLYPGHFAPRDDATDWIEWYLQHRQEREDQILEVMENNPAAPGEIAAKIYSSYPGDLLPIAERQVLAHLEKLESEGRVHKHSDQWRKS